jgi:lysine/ornithine N-monooxygenase
MVYDVVTVGAGPAGLSAAIRLKQLAQETGTDMSLFHACALPWSPGHDPSRPSQQCPLCKVRTRTKFDEVQ